MVCQYFVLEAGKTFVKKKGKLTEKDLKAENNLPMSKVVYKYFGSINNYQKAIDAPITLVNRFISETARLLSINVCGTQESSIPVAGIREKQRCFFFVVIIK